MALDPASSDWPSRVPFSAHGLNSLAERAVPRFIKLRN
jgi:hypothetical protein